MAAVEVTITGVLYDKLSRTSRPVVLIGEATLTGYGVGGGPVVPPEGGGGSPPSIWPSPGHPAHPIAPGGAPPGIWGPNDPRPTPPIANVPGVPGSPDEPPTEPIDPPVEWKAVWHPTEGWIVVGVVNPPDTHPAPSE